MENCYLHSMDPFWHGLIKRTLIVLLSTVGHWTFHRHATSFLIFNWFISKMKYLLIFSKTNRTEYKKNKIKWKPSPSPRWMSIETECTSIINLIVSTAFFSRIRVMHFGKKCWKIPPAQHYSGHFHEIEVCLNDNKPIIHIKNEILIIILHFEK